MICMGIKMQKKKKHPFLIALLWVAFIALVAGIMYLSFQNGTKAKAIGDQLVEYIADIQYPNKEMSVQEKETLTYEVRQAGRVLAFFMIGIIGTITIHVSCKKCNWIIKTSVTAMILVAIAYFTEKLKVYIPSRHYNYEEMLMSIIAVIVGFALVSLITLTAQTLKGVVRLMTAVH